jgi:hypothetical protein
MRRGHILAMALLATIGCKDAVNPGSGATEKSSGDGVTASGVVYGFTAAPDSQRTALAGATVTLVRISDLPPPLPPGPDTLTSGGLAAVLDSFVPPPDTTQPPPPPPATCDAGETVAQAQTGSDGSWSLTGLENGIYNVRVEAPAGTQWRSIEYCGWVVQNDRNEITLYLPFGPGPDPLP